MVSFYVVIILLKVVFLGSILFAVFCRKWLAIFKWDRALRKAAPDGHDAVIRQLVEV